MIEILILTVILVILAIATVLYLKREYKDETIHQNKKIWYYIIQSIFFAGVVTLLILNSCNEKPMGFIDLFKWIVILQGAFLIGTTDLYECKIHNIVLFALIVFRVGTMIYELFVTKNVRTTVLLPLQSMIIASAILLLARLAIKNSVAFGDVKLLGVIGLYNSGTAILSTMLYCLLANALMAVVLLVSRKKKIKDSMPMAPSVFVGLFAEFILRIIGG